MSGGVCTQAVAVVPSEACRAHRLCATARPASHLSSCCCSESGAAPTARAAPLGRLAGGRACAALAGSGRLAASEALPLTLLLPWPALLAAGGTSACVLGVWRCRSSPAPPRPEPSGATAGRRSCRVAPADSSQAARAAGPAGDCGQKLGSGRGTGRRLPPPAVSGTAAAAASSARPWRELAARGREVTLPLSCRPPAADKPRLLRAEGRARSDGSTRALLLLPAMPLPPCTLLLLLLVRSLLWLLLWTEAKMGRPGCCCCEPPADAWAAATAAVGG